MRIAIGSDHAGFALKEAVKPFLTAADREVIDLGTHSTDPVDYSDYAESVGQALRDKRTNGPSVRKRRWRLDGCKQDSKNLHA
jgi:ribose 5-phosphate isomerase RpiB